MALSLALIDSYIDELRNLKKNYKNTIKQQLAIEVDLRDKILTCEFFSNVLNQVRMPREILLKMLFDSKTVFQWVQTKEDKEKMYITLNVIFDDLIYDKKGCNEIVREEVNKIKTLATEREQIKAEIKRYVVRINNFARKSRGYRLVLINHFNKTSDFLIEERQKIGLLF